MARTVFIPCASDKWERMTDNAKARDRATVARESRFGYVDPDAQLCSMQRQQHASGYVMAEISTNIYGFCVRDTLNDGHGTLFSARLGGSAKAAVEFARRWHAQAPDKREVIVGYIDANRRAEWDAATTGEPA